ncbi:MAG: hypothetical protein BIFFINMI_02391 [Phycisphaerae bacterium]|nr:hypothetical protein [Phycisphaerae bacterium]
MTKNCPTYLSRRAKAVYKALKPFVEQGPITPDLLAVYAEAVSDFEEATAQLAEQGKVIKSQSGYLQPNPYVAIRNKAAMTVWRFGVLLNLTKGINEEEEVERMTKLLLKPA